MSSVRIVSVALACACLASHAVQAQQTAPEPSSPPPVLRVTGDVATPLTLTAADLKGMPRARAEIKEDARTVVYEGVPIVEEDSSVEEEATVMQPSRQALPWMPPELQAPPPSESHATPAPAAPMGVGMTAPSSRPPGAGPTMAARSLPPEAAFWDSVVRRCRELVQEERHRPAAIAVAVMIALVLLVLMIRACA